MKQAGLMLLAILSAAYGAIGGNFLWLAIGAVLILLASAGFVGAATPQDFERMGKIGNVIFGAPWSLCLIGALIASGVATWLAGQNIFSRASGYSWLLALLLVLLAGILHDWQHAPVALAGETEAIQAQQSASKARLWDRLDWLALILLTLVALGLRLYQLDGFLPTLHGDEGEMGMLALLALHGPASGLSAQPLPFFATGFLDHPTLFHYLQAGALLLFGESETGLRMLSALFGALCAPLIYAIGRFSWGRVAGLTAGWLLAVSHLHIHYSRIALNNIQTVWFMILFILLFVLLYERWPYAAVGSTDLRDNNRPSLLLAVALGLVIGLSQYFYYGSRLLPLLALFYLLYLWRANRINRAQFVGLVVATVVAYLPLFAFYSQNLPAFINRTRGVTVFTPDGLVHTLGPNAVWPRDIPLLFWEQTKLTFNFFVQSGDRSAFYLADIPAFDPITVLLFWLGLGTMLSHIRRFHEFTILSWFGLGILLSSILTNDAPNGPRLIVVVPAIYLIASAFVQQVYTFFANGWPPLTRWGGALLGGALAAAILYLNFTTYFVTYRHVIPNLMPISVAHEMEDNHAQFRSFFFGAPQMSVDYGTLRFVAHDAEKYDVTDVQQAKGLIDSKPHDRGLLFIALPNHKTDLEQIEHLYPNGVAGSHQSPLGALLYLTYRIPAPQPK